MSRRSKIWLVVAVLFVVVNLVGAGMAIAAAELLHATVHTVLALAGAYAAGRLLATRRVATY
jgi:hypothetical protein